MSTTANPMDTPINRMIALILPFVVLHAGCTPTSEHPSASNETVEAALESPTRATPAPTSSMYFVVSGALEVTVDPAEAMLAKNTVGIWALSVNSSRESVRKLGQGYLVNLFFSNEFSGAPGTYPIRFAYLDKPNTLGGSFYSRDLFSHDTEGSAEFTEFEGEVAVRFEFTTYSESEGSADRRAVTVKGEARCLRGDFP